MDVAVAAATAMFPGAIDGELERFKKCVEAIDRLIGDGIASIVENSKDDYGKGVIHFAAGGGNVEVLKYLIKEFKLDVNVRDNSGVTPLSWAAIEGQYAAVEYLLEMGANPEMPDNSNCTPLHHAAVKGHKDVIPLLLSKGINVDVTNELGSPLQFAATHGLHDTVKVLLDHGANPNLFFHDAYTPLHSSIDSRSLQCVASLLKAGADPNGGPDGVKALLIAAEMGETQIIKLLVEAGADPNVTDIALQVKPGDAAVLCNRSLCYVYLNNGDLAFQDATLCMLARPDWPKAYYRAGVALKMLNRLNDAENAFFDGLKLDPGNKELEDAFREVSLHKLKAINVPL